ncbi:Stage V sporulation protein B [Clostridiaceae bacterium JG1575]|nr:Stage V sporulation protein B [Clostridiaceae bacterium JG1575]
MSPTLKEESTSEGFLALTLASFLVKLLSLIYVPLLLYLIKAEAHGVYITAYDFFAFAFVITNEGLTKGIARMVSDRMARGDLAGAHQVFRMTRRMLLVLGLAVGAALTFGAGPLSELAQAPKAREALTLLGPSVAVCSVSSAYRGYFQGRRVLKQNAISMVLEQSANVLFSLLFAVLLLPISMEMGVAGATSGTLLGALLSVAYLMWVHRRTQESPEALGSALRENRTVLRTLLAYTLPLSIATAATQFGNIIDVINVKSRLVVSGLSTAQANIAYSQLSSCKTMIAVPLTVMAALATSLFPAITRAVALGDREEVARKVNLSVKLNYLLCFPSAVGLMVVAGPANRAIFDGAAERGLLIALGAGVVVFSGLILIQTVLLQAAGYQRQVLKPLILGIVVKLLFNYFLVGQPQWRAQGAVVGSYAQSVVTFLLCERIIRGSYRLAVPHGALAAKAALGSLLMGAVLWGVQRLVPVAPGRLANAGLLLGLMVLGIFTYGAWILGARAVKFQEFSNLAPKLARKLPPSFKRFFG